MKQVFFLIRDLLVAGLLITILVFSLFGIGLPYRFPVVSVGLFELADFDAGLSIYQFGRIGAFYTISPLNDYVLDEDGFREPLVEWETLEQIKNNSERENYNWRTAGSKFGQIRDVVLTYINKLDPVYEVDTERVRVSYVSLVDENSVEIKRKVHFKSNQIISGQGMTLTYSEDDIVFDLVSRGVFSETAQDELDWVAKVYGVDLFLYSNEGSVSRVGSDKAVGVINPDVPGMLVVRTSQDKNLVVDTRYGLIEVVEKEQLWGKELESVMRITAVVEMEDWL